MEKLSVEKRTEVSKMSTERLRARLIKAVYDEDEVFEMDRSRSWSWGNRNLSSRNRKRRRKKREENRKKREAKWVRDEKTGTRVPERETGEGRRAERRRSRSAEAAWWVKVTAEENQRRDREMRFERWSYRGRELKMRRRGSGKSPWRDKLVFTGRR